jgi:hypothetical protein
MKEMLSAGLTVISLVHAWAFLGVEWDHAPRCEPVSEIMIQETNS